MSAEISEVSLALFDGVYFHLALVAFFSQLFISEITYLITLDCDYF